jgi:hypothetical protein
LKYLFIGLRDFSMVCHPWIYCTLSRLFLLHYCPLPFLSPYYSIAFSVLCYAKNDFSICENLISKAKGTCYSKNLCKIEIYLMWLE